MSLHLPRHAPWWVLVAVVVLLPWPLASNRTFIYLPLLALVSAAVLMSCLAAAWSRSRRSLTAPFFGWRGAVLAPYAALLSLWTLMIISHAGEPVGDGLASAPMLAAALQEWLWLALAALTLLCASSRNRIRYLLIALTATATLVALAAIVAALLDHSGAARGPFINRNHYANYCLLGMSAGLALLVAELGHHEAREGWRAQARSVVELLFSQRARLRLALLAMAVAIVMSRSRLGNTALLAALLAVSLLALALIRRPPRSLFLLLASLVALDLVVIGSLVGMERVAASIAQTATVAVQDGARLAREVDRVEANRVGWSMVGAAPLLGTGPGSYGERFAEVRTERFFGHFDHAHNDYLEVLVEYGWLGLLCWLLPMLSALASAAWALRHRHDPLMRGLAIGASFGIIGTMIHAGGEFVFKIPANAGTFAVLMALALCASLPLGKRRSRRRERMAGP